jgi:anti-anti-sigma factor
MQLSFTEGADGIRRINLAGKLDDVGVREIETSFAGHCAGERVRVLVDLSGVDFMASIGIRLLVVSSRSVAAHGGKLVLLNPNPLVRNIFDVADISALIPIYSDLQSAEAALEVL